MHKLLSCCAVLLALAAPAHAQTLFTVALRPLADQKAVFATVESPNARAGPHPHRWHAGRPIGAPG